MNIDEIVSEIYFETIGCPESYNENYLKNKIKFIISNALYSSMNEIHESMADILSLWEKGRQHERLILSDRIVNFINNLIADKMISSKNEYENAADLADEEMKKFKEGWNSHEKSEEEEILSSSMV